MNCPKCGTALLEDDVFCPKCGSRSSVQANDKQPGMSTGSAGIDAELCEQFFRQEDSEKKRSASLAFFRFLLVFFICIVLLLTAAAGAIALKGGDPLEYAKNLINGLTSVSQSDLNNVSDTELSLSDISASDASSTQSTTATSSASSAERTTTTTTKNLTGEKIRAASVGKWSTDIEALGISLSGINLKTLTVTLDEKGSADIGYKIAFIKSSTTGSFTVADDGSTTLKILIPITNEEMVIEGTSKLVSKDRIIFTCANGDVVLDRIK